MKKYILALSTLLSANAFADWSYEVDNNNGIKTYNTYAFDSSFESSMALSCDQDSKDVLISILADSKFSKKKVNRVVFSFDNEPPIFMNVPYNEYSSYFSKLTLKDNNNDIAMYNIVEMLKAKSNLEVTLINEKEKEFKIKFSLKGSSLAINQLLNNCKL